MDCTGICLVGFSKQESMSTAYQEKKSYRWSYHSRAAFTFFSFTWDFPTAFATVQRAVAKAPPLKNAYLTVILAGKDKCVKYIFCVFHTYSTRSEI